MHTFPISSHAVCGSDNLDHARVLEDKSACPAISQQNKEEECENWKWVQNINVLEWNLSASATTSVLMYFGHYFNYSSYSTLNRGVNFQFLPSSLHVWGSLIFKQISLIYLLFQLNYLIIYCSDWTIWLVTMLPPCSYHNIISCFVLYSLQLISLVVRHKSVQYYHFGTLLIFLLVQ